MQARVNKGTMKALSHCLQKCMVMRMTTSLTTKTLNQAPQNSFQLSEMFFTEKEKFQKNKSFLILALQTKFTSVVEICKTRFFHLFHLELNCRNGQILKLSKDGSPEANLDFIFHNKVPKSGSSTMKHILNYLSKRNKFALDHVRIVKFGYEDNLRLAHHIPKFRYV